MSYRTLATILSAVLAVCIALGLLATPATAHAAQAYLVSCNSTSSPVSGRLVYVGVYEYGGRRYEFVFPTYCPSTVEIY